MWPCRVTKKFKFEDLRAHGPLIEAMWATHNTVTDPISGVVLLDTGASGIMIDESIAERLELNVTGSDKIHGANGWASTNKHLANLLIPVSNNEGQNILFNCPVECSSVPDLYNRHMKIFNKPVIGILGRNFLQFCTVNICGESGSLDLYINSSITKAR